MDFEQDLFISYAHIDNQPLSPQETGWVTRFHKTLATLLSMRMGGNARIWRDDKLDGNDVFADEIVDQFADTAVLVSVLTPRYLNSEWCSKEIAEFCKTAEQTGGIVVENKARVFKVLKTPVDSQERLPDVVKETLGYEFFVFEDEAPLELDPAFGEKFAQDYNRKVGKLAWDISQLLKKLEAAVGEQQASTDDDSRNGEATAKPTVYLAECSYDLKQKRETLEGELKRLGYTVLPDQQLPRDEEDYVRAVASSLELCGLAIHLVGEKYGAVPDGPTTKSATMLQNELAAQRSKSNGCRRVIWLPKGTRSEEEKQQAFIDSLYNDAEAQLGADVITGDFEELKASIHATLKKLEEPVVKPPREQSADADGPKLIYLICDEKDRKATVPLRRYLRDRGFDVQLPVFDGDATAVREAHQQLLANCDAVLLFYGAGDEAWKHNKDRELKKMPGFRGGKPLLASYTYLADPKTPDKEDLIDMEEPNLINGVAGFSEAELAAFTQAMQPSGATS